MTEASLGNVQDQETGCVGPGEGGERKKVWDRKEQQEPGRKQPEMSVGSEEREGPLEQRVPGGQQKCAPPMGHSTKDTLIPGQQQGQLASSAGQFVNRYKNVKCAFALTADGRVTTLTIPNLHPPVAKPFET